MLFIALILGLIEGMTEFLPVSSTGHLILFGEILGFKGPPGKTFEIVIQLGAILAICWLYRAKLSSTTVGLINREAKDWRFAIGILLAFTPAMVLGALFHEVIKEHLFNPFSVSIALIIGGIIILLVERYKPKPRHQNIEDFSLALCFKIGLCQCLALIPGTSRSGATIIGALLLGADRKAATEFSFFLAIPTMFAATIFGIYDNWELLSFDNVQLIAVGFIAAFVSALLVVRWVVSYIAKHGFAPFAIYRIVLGTVMLYLLS
ncbi:MAG: undecaprenyl-diphosphate phosphatase [Rickettsiales bacterium]|jgi:undecaprenyl-diphosphatase